MWDADTGQPIGAPLTGHTDQVQSVAFSPDGRRIHTATTRRKRCQTTSATTTFTHSANTEKCCGS